MKNLQRYPGAVVTILKIMIFAILPLQYTQLQNSLKRRNKRGFTATIKFKDILLRKIIQVSEKYPKRTHRKLNAFLEKKGVWNNSMPKILQDLQLEIKNETTYILAPHGLGDVACILGVIMRFKSKWKEHEWIILCREHVHSLIQGLELNNVSARYLTQVEISKLLSSEQTYNLASKITSDYKVIFPRLDDHVSIGFSSDFLISLTRLNINGILSQAQSYVLLACPLLDLKVLQEYEFNEILKELFTPMLNRKILQSTRIPTSIQNQLREAESGNRTVVYINTTARSIDSPEDVYLEAIAKTVQDYGSQFAVITNDEGFALRHGFMLDRYKISESLALIKSSVDLVISPVCGFLNLIVTLDLARHISLCPSNRDGDYQFGPYQVISDHYFRQSTFDHTYSMPEYVISYSQESEVNDVERFTELMMEALDKQKHNSNYHSTVCTISEPTKELVIPCSAGELLDKLSILRVKLRYITDHRKRVEILKEAEILQSTYSTIRNNASSPHQIDNILAELEMVNENAWQQNEKIYNGYADNFGTRDYIISLDDINKNDKLLSRLVESAVAFRTSQELNKERVELKNKATSIIHIGSLEAKSFKQNVFE